MSIIFQTFTFITLITYGSALKLSRRGFNFRKLSTGGLYVEESVQLRVSKTSLHMVRYQCNVGIPLFILTLTERLLIPLQKVLSKVAIGDNYEIITQLQQYSGVPFSLVEDRGACGVGFIASLRYFLAILIAVF